MTTLQDALRQAAQQGLPRVDAQMLMLHTMGQPTHARAWLMTHDDTVLTPEQLARWQHCVAQRLSGVPVAYLIGHKAFYGLQLGVDARVLDPRPDTEVLVDWALERLQATLDAGSTAPHALDLGTGSGAIALAMAHMQPAAQVSAVDASADALAVARANAQQLGLKVQFTLSNWLAALPADMRFSLIVSNPPYIRHDDPHLPALRHEPLQALTSGADGLDDIRHILRQSPAHLLAGGWLLLEHGWDQAQAVQQLMRDAGFAEVQSRRDLGGQWRCTGGCWPNPAAA